MEEKILAMLEKMDKKIDSLEERMDKRFDGLENDMKEVKEKLDAVYNQVADLTEFKTYAKEKIENIESALEVFNKENFEKKVEINKIKKVIGL